MENRIEHAIALRDRGQLKESLKMLISLSKEYSSSELHYQIAVTYDKNGKETLAIPYYKSAIKQGLDSVTLSNAFLGLGSSYRTIGAYSLAKKTLMKAIKQYPRDNSLKVFYAMTLYNLKEFKKAIQLTLTLLAKTSQDENIRHYARAIEYYATNLDKKFK